MMVSGIVLAGGASSRMGRPKALLTVGTTTFLRRIVEVLHAARVTDIVIVLGSQAAEISSGLGWFTGTVVRNQRWQEQGQISSLVAGLAGLDREEVQGAMICPVDHPLITQATIVDLLQAFWHTPKDIIVPTFRGKRGHPVIFRRTLFRELREAHPEAEGARAVVKAHAGDVLEIPTEDAGVITDIDTPEEYAAALSGLH
jgi:molybdenum cofactor cytidylyltransferase